MTVSSMNKFNITTFPICRYSVMKVKKALKATIDTLGKTVIIGIVILRILFICFFAYP